MFWNTKTLTKIINRKYCILNFIVMQLLSRFVSSMYTKVRKKIPVLCPESSFSIT